MSLRAETTTTRDGHVTLQHATHCPVNTHKWSDCTCDLFQGWDKPLARAGNHKESCPCHCTCDFFTVLAKIVR